MLFWRWNGWRNRRFSITEIVKIWRVVVYTFRVVLVVRTWAYSSLDNWYIFLSVALPPFIFYEGNVLSGILFWSTSATSLQKIRSARCYSWTLSILGAGKEVQLLTSIFWHRLGAGSGFRSLRRWAVWTLFLDQEGSHSGGAEGFGKESESGEHIFLCSWLPRSDFTLPSDCRNVTGICQSQYRAIVKVLLCGKKLKGGSRFSICLRHEPFLGGWGVTVHFCMGDMLLLSFSSADGQAFFHILRRGYMPLYLRVPCGCTKPASVHLRTHFQLTHLSGEHKMQCNFKFGILKWYDQYSMLLTNIRRKVFFLVKGVYIM